MTTAAIKVKSVKIEGLFEIFNYDIQYPKDENVLILTGPNGYGKTQVLNILSNLFERNFSFFESLAFNRICVELSNQTAIEIVKPKDESDNDNDEIESLKFIFFHDDVEVERFDYSVEYDPWVARHIDRLTDLDRVMKDVWYDSESNTYMSYEQMLTNYASVLPQPVIEVLNTPNLVNSQLIGILDSINVHLIKEQRLFKQVKSSRTNSVGGKSTVMIETIETYASELKALIDERLNESYEETQKLDSSYPVRLVSEKGTLTKEQYNTKFIELQEKQEKLVKNGLAEKIQEALDFSEDDAKALLVYLNDLETKLSVFDNLVEKLELFTNILNERRFTFKSIKISKDKGFYFETSTGKPLTLNQLSSGEQHEVVLLFELIFKTSPSILVLIDEPEISLHITWQKEFLEDLLKIIKLQQFQVMVATHSPSIVNGRWDLVYELNKPQNVENH